MHESKDTRNYYIALLLCYYYETQKGHGFDEILKKLKYKNNDIWKYQNILNSFSNINEQAFEQIFNISKSEQNRDDAVSAVREKLEKQLERIKEKQKKNLKRKMYLLLLRKGLTF